MMGGSGKKNLIHMVTFILLVVGGLNWLLVAFNFNLVDYLFGEGSAISMIVYILVGASALYELATHKANCKECESMMKKSATGVNTGSMGSSGM